MPRDANGVEEHIVVAKIIAPSVAVPDAVKQMIAAAAAKVLGVLAH